ncbi:MAG TPA: hypothetical protein VF144_16695 [Chitinophagaceae bacterium]
MQKQSVKNRKGDTSRTSSQGRKRSSGGSLTKKKGSPDRNEHTKNEVKDEKPKKLKIPAKAIVR